MGSEWSIALLEEIAEVLDSRHKTPQYADEGLPMVRVVDIKGGCLSLDETKKVSVVDYNDYSKGRDPQIGDLLISRVGSYGNIAYVDNVEKFCLGQNTALIIPKIHWRYLYYQLISPFTKAQIEQMVVGAVQKTISLKTIRALEIPLPPLPEQKAIAHILGSLDDKIELNRRMNATLEGMAQALFKSWFVDFDPVIDNALAAGNPIPDELAARAEVRREALANATTQQGSVDHPTLSDPKSLFPDAFQETKSMGWIPEGWKITHLEDLCETITKGTTPRKSDVEAASDEPSVQFLKVKDINEDFSIDLNSLTRIPASVHTGVLKRSIIKAHDLVFSIAGTIGRIAVIGQSLHDSNCNQAVGIIRLENPDDHLALALFSLASKRVQDDIHSKVTQGVQANASLTNLRDIEILIPSDDVKKKWANQLNSLLERIQANQTQSTSLGRLRDTLLPRLISGDLQVDETEKLTQQALA